MTDDIILENENELEKTKAINKNMEVSTELETTEEMQIALAKRPIINPVCEISRPITNMVHFVGNQIWDILSISTRVSNEELIPERSELYLRIMEDGERLRVDAATCGFRSAELLLTATSWAAIAILNFMAMLAEEGTKFIMELKEQNEKQNRPSKGTDNRLQRYELERLQLIRHRQNELLQLMNEPQVPPTSNSYALAGMVVRIFQTIKSKMGISKPSDEMKISERAVGRDWSVSSVGSQPNYVSRIEQNNTYSHPTRQRTIINQSEDINENDENADISSPQARNRQGNEYNQYTPKSKRKTRSRGVDTATNSSSDSGRKKPIYQIHEQKQIISPYVQSYTPPRLNTLTPMSQRKRAEQKISGSSNTEIPIMDTPCMASADIENKQPNAKKLAAEIRILPKGDSYKRSTYVTARISPNSSSNQSPQSASIRFFPQGNISLPITNMEQQNVVNQPQNAVSQSQNAVSQSQSVVSQPQMLYGIPTKQIFHLPTKNKPTTPTKTSATVSSMTLQTDKAANQSNPTGKSAFDQTQYLVNPYMPPIILTTKSQPLQAS